MLTPVRATVTEQPDGSLAYQLRCSCLTVRGLAAPWEAAAGLWVRLDAEHRRRAPLCPHRMTRVSGPDTRAPMAPPKLRALRPLTPASADLHTYNSPEGGCRSQTPRAERLLTALGVFACADEFGTPCLVEKPR